jgi:predicted enzyme related to lactoylglutathione lyase
MTAKHQIVGIGGIFFKAHDPAALAAWYRDQLGVPVEPGSMLAAFSGTEAKLVWATFPSDTTYFMPSTAPFMINYRVSDLDAMLTQLKSAGVKVEDRIEESEFGRFGWAMDPEGNRFELWQPPSQ